VADWRDELALLADALKAQNNTLGNLGDAPQLQRAPLPPQLPQFNLQELESPGRGGFAAGGMTLPVLGNNAFLRGNYSQWPGAPANYRLMLGFGGRF
jgi:hypothetical protein